ncbi:hypothetical protein PVAND_016577 [Polypedilum vanderplanki]|uniref:Uncharacterized protein n=1 Tax=Polypedilum vanderplanki TaxID=319348 RepID=A0A9J6BFZ7_POLVA|nr:hypothetical protein PVAND_016577 [Polypedilum vanderplanki]
MTISILFGGMFFSFKYTSPQKEHHHHKPEKHTMMDEGQTHEVGHVVEEHEKEPNLELLALTTVDFLIRSYMTLCVYSLLIKFKGERVESGFMNGSDKQRLSYGSGTGSMDKITDNCSIINER